MPGLSRPDHAAVVARPGPASEPTATGILATSGFGGSSFGYSATMSIEYSFTVTSPRSAEDVYDYLADLNNLPEWDPETKEAKQTSEGEAQRVGARFRLRAGRWLGTGGMGYEVVELERPHRIVARGDSALGGGTDTFTIRSSDDGGSEVVYTTQVKVKGLGRIATPVARTMVNRSGERTRRGLAEALNGR